MLLLRRQVSFFFLIPKPLGDFPPTPPPRPPPWETFATVLFIPEILKFHSAMPWWGSFFIYFPGTHTDTATYIFLSCKSGKFSGITLKISFLLFSGFFSEYLLIKCQWSFVPGISNTGVLSIQPLQR